MHRGHKQLHLHGLAAANPGCGKQLRQGEKWTLSNINGSGRIWGGTKCAFGSHDGRSGGNCESGDCNVLLECRANGRAPNTVGEYSINQANNNDIFYISALVGFNFPMEFRPARALSPTSISSRNRASSKFTTIDEIGPSGQQPSPATKNPQLSTTGFELAQGESRSVDVPSPWSGCFWARSRCSADSSGKFSCITGYCGSGRFECNGAGSAPPVNLVEITIENDGQEYYDVSNVDGFNLPVLVVPQGWTGECRESSCPVNINSDCPAQLQLKDGSEVVGCKSACAVFNQPQYCCTGPNDTPETCLPTAYSRFFEEKCPQAYSYAYDDKNSTFTRSSKPDYVITFCP